MTPLTINTPLSGAFDSFKSSIPSLSRDDLLKARRTLEQVECGLPAPNLTKTGKSAIEGVILDDGPINVCFSHSYLTTAGFLYSMLASATPAERQTADAAIFARLSLAEETVSSNEPVVCRGEKAGVMEWLNAFAERAAADDVLTCKGILMKHMAAKSTVKRADLLKISTVSFEISENTIVLELTPKERKRVEFFASLLPSLTPKQIIAIDMKLSNALLNPITESGPTTAGEAGPPSCGAEDSTSSQATESAPEGTETTAAPAY
jgi:hypothetical protein